MPLLADAESLKCSLKEYIFDNFFSTGDIYDNPEYIRKRLGNPAEGSYDPVIAKYYVKRLDSSKV
jgi:hypothetical protein